MTAKGAPRYLQQAEAAWLNGDYTSSTTAMAAKTGAEPNFVKEGGFDPVALPVGVSCEPLYWQGEQLPSYLVRFDKAVAVFDIGVPLAQDGTFLSQAFCHLKYPERYYHLFSLEAGEALNTAAHSEHCVSDAYVTLVRPPYYHWLMDTLPHLFGVSRLHHVKQIKLIAPDSHTLEPWQKALLERATRAFGIANLSCLPLNGTAVGVRPAYSQTRLPLRDRLALVRSIAPRSQSTQAPLMLYSRRSATDGRKLVNEDQVIAALGERFTVIEPRELDLETQMSLFAQARCIVGVHGSNLANTAFCKPGTAVVEIAAGLPQPHFQTLAQAADLSFQRVMADPIGEATEAKTWAQSRGDLTVDPAAVVQAVDDLLAVTNP